MPLDIANFGVTATRDGKTQGNSLETLPTISGALLLPLLLVVLLLLLQLTMMMMMMNY